MPIYYSLGVEGMPYGKPLPSEKAARAAAQAAMHEFNDVERVEILKIETRSFGYERRKLPITHEVKPVRVERQPETLPLDILAMLPDDLRETADPLPMPDIL